MIRNITDIVCAALISVLLIAVIRLIKRSVSEFLTRMAKR